MTVEAAPANTIQCEYRTIEELVYQLDQTLFMKRVVMTVMNGLDQDVMSSGFSAVDEHVEVKGVAGADSEVYISIHVVGFGMIRIRNAPLVHEGVAYPAQVDITGSHVNIRYAYPLGEGEYRKVVKVYHAISAIRPLDQ